MCKDVVAKLADAVYPIVQIIATRRNATISYSDVCDKLGGTWSGCIQPDSDLLAAALGFIVDACRAAGLPALSALVVHKGSDQRPGNGYFLAAHPGVEDPMMREIAWGNERVAVYKATYPATLAELLLMSTGKG